MNDEDEVIIEEEIDEPGRTSSSANESFMEHESAPDPAATQLQEVNNGQNAGMNNPYQRPNQNHSSKANDLRKNQAGRNNPGNNPNNHQRPNLGVPSKENKDNPQLPQNGPKTPNKNDVGSRNLQNSLANKARNLWQNRKRKKKGKGDEQKKEETPSQTEEKSSENTSDNSDDSSGNGETISEKLKKIKRIKLIIKIVAILVIVFMAIVFILSIFVAITGIDLAKTIPAYGVATYDTDNFQSVYEKDTAEYKNEVAYYKKLKEVKEDYDKEHGDELKTNYIHAILLYKYYNVETNDKNAKGEDIPIDYSKLKDKVDTYVELFKSSGNDDVIDYEKKGGLYNALKESQEFKDYYGTLIEERNIDELLDEIFDFAKEMDEIEVPDNTVMTDETQVTVSKPSSSKTEKVETKTISITDYLSESIYANAPALNNTEAVKAYTIAYSTNIVAQNKKLTIDSNSASVTGQTCSTTKGCSYNSSSVLVDGPGEQSSKNSVYYNGGYYYKKPLTDSEAKSLSKTVNNVFGNVLVNSDGTYPNLDISKLSGLGEGDYKTILTNTYGSYKIKNIGESSYVLDASYGDKKVLVNVKFYDQGNYSGYSFCGLKKETIASSGCGVTSMAMVVSTYENNSKYDPLWTNDIARKNGQCGSNRGTDYSHFTHVAKKMGYKTPIVYTKNKSNGWKLPKTSYNNILKHLAKGDLVIVNVTKGHFTSGGHYMVLGGIDPETKKVYVYDPNNKSNSRYRKTGNGWWSFNDIIAPESKAFIIIQKKG